MACPQIDQEISSLHGKMVAQGTIYHIAMSNHVQAVSKVVSQNYLVSFAHKQSLRALRAGMGDNEAAFLRSASGSASAAFLDPPLDDRWVISDKRFSVACLRRLNVAFPMCSAIPANAPLCNNVTVQGRVCGAVCDARGMHLECCSPGGGLIHRHDSMVQCLAVLAKRNLDPRARTEQIIPELARPVRGQVGQARLDVIMHNGIERMLVDVVIVSSYAGDANFRAACARRDGHASRRASIMKHTRYPSADLIPFALETGGRIGTEARALLLKIAEASDDSQTELAYLYRAVSSVLQDGIARQLLGS